MRHKRVGRKLGVVTKHRRAMLRNLAVDLFRYDSIKTTDTRAKELRRFAERLITMAKKGTLQYRRQAAAYIKDKEILKKLFSEIAEKHKERPGGYTRIIKLGFRKGDNAPISLIELVQDEYKPKSKKKSTKKKTEPKVTEKSSDFEKSSKKESAEELGLIESTVDSTVETKVINEDIPDVSTEKQKLDVRDEVAGELEPESVDGVETEGQIKGSKETVDKNSEHTSKDELENIADVKADSETGQEREDSEEK